MSPKSSAHVDGESDGRVVPMKGANKGGPPSADRPEGRRSTKENIEQPPPPRTQSRTRESSGLPGVGDVARKEKRTRFTALLHHVTVERLRDSFYALQREAAPGVDGMTPRRRARRSGLPGVPRGLGCPVRSARQGHHSHPRDLVNEREFIRPQYARMPECRLSDTRERGGHASPERRASASCICARIVHAIHPHRSTSPFGRYEPSVPSAASSATRVAGIARVFRPTIAK
jgi:hypothetical protein